MTEECFLHRWSRRKEAARDESASSGEPQEGREPIPGPEVAEVDPADLPPTDFPPADFPPADLPPIDSLDETSDYTAFLKAGVPRVLRHAALRKAWSSNPAITGHKPLVDYDWDFHAPGYGKLWPVDDPARFVKALFAHLSAPAEEASPAQGDEVPPDDKAAPEPAAEPAAVAEAVDPPVEPSDMEDQRSEGTLGRSPDVPLS